MGIVGDSASGKTTLSRGLVRVLGEDSVTRVCIDDYHRYDRARRTELGLTPLNPECNYIDIIAQHMALLRRGEAILKPVYRHSDGTFGPPEYVVPTPYTIIEGLLAYHTEAMRDACDVRIYLAPPESLRRQWKVDRDCARRGYTTDQVLGELDRRETDSAAFIRPQERHADLVVSFRPGTRGDSEHLDAEITFRSHGLPHPDLRPFTGGGAGGITLLEGDEGDKVNVPGDLAPERAAEIEESIWDRMRFASHLRAQRLGEFTAGTSLHRSESLAVVQLLILYHLVTARASLALGGSGGRQVSRSVGPLAATG